MKKKGKMFPKWDLTYSWEGWEETDWFVQHCAYRCYSRWKRKPGWFVDCGTGKHICSCGEGFKESKRLKDKEIGLILGDFSRLYAEVVREITFGISWEDLINATTLCVCSKMRRNLILTYSLLGWLSY